jgi:uncharacterized protein
MTLDSIQARVLGALIEKEIVTPENYPLSINALVNACNQKSSREPVMDLTEEQVQQALHRLDDLGLTNTSRDSRVAKFEHRARTVFNLRRDETALLCLLLLRGPQTPGELRSRSDRMYTFDGTDAVESTLTRLAALPDSPPESQNAAATEAEASLTTTTVPQFGALPIRPLITILPRQPGSRESRYAHLLSGPVEASAIASNAPRAYEPASLRTDSDLLDRISRLEAEVAELRAAVARIEDRLPSNFGINMGLRS